MRKNLMIAVVICLYLFACKKDNNTANANNTSIPSVPDSRDKFVGTWEGMYYIEIPNTPPNTPLDNLPDSVPTSIIITKSQTIDSEILISINNTITGNRSVKAFVNGDRYFYEPFSSRIFNFIDVSFRGDGLLGSNSITIKEEGYLRTSAANIPFIGNIPSLIGVWSSKLLKK